jgi:hypothetical protein
VLLFCDQLVGRRANPAAARLILGAHIGFDRALGFGLKLPTSFRDTHLGRIGRSD